MKAKFNRDALLAAFQLAASVVPARSPRPVLVNVRLDVQASGADGPQAVVTGTDLDTVGLRYQIAGVEVEEPGSVLLPAAQTGAMLRELEDLELTIAGSGKGVSVYAGESEFELPGEDPEAFPDIGTFSSDRYHQVAADVAGRLAERTVFAAAEESMRYALTGVLWRAEGPKITLVATDGRRLAVAEGEGEVIGEHSTAGSSPVVPTRAMQLLVRTLAGGADPLQVYFVENEAFFRIGRLTLIARLVEGRFPPYQEVFPKKWTTRVQVAAGALHRAVRQAAIFADREQQGVTLRFAKNKLAVTAAGRERGRARVELPVQLEGNSLEISFDPRFFTDFLRVLPEDQELVAEMTERESPALFRAGGDYQYLVMPLSIAA